MLEQRHPRALYTPRRHLPPACSSRSPFLSYSLSALCEDWLLLEKAGGERKGKTRGRHEGVLPACLRLPAVRQLAEQLRYPPFPPSQLVVHQGTVERQAGGAPSIAGGFGGSFLQKWKSGYLVLTWDRYLHLFREEADVEADEKACWSVYLGQAEVRNTQLGLFGTILTSVLVLFALFTARVRNVLTCLLSVARFSFTSIRGLHFNPNPTPVHYTRPRGIAWSSLRRYWMSACSS